jgi:hypothetical protein
MATSGSLFAVASPSSGPLHAELEVHKGRYVDYLRSRFRDAPAGSPIHIGFGYRLLRSLTEDRAYREALDIFAELRQATLSRLGIDISKPLDVAAQVLDADIDFNDVPTKYPFCLAGLLYCRGAIAAAYERRAELAAAYFVATRFAAQTILRSLNRLGMSDGNLARLPSLAMDAMTAAVKDVEER